jgi:hypothetical protein
MKALALRRKQSPDLGTILSAFRWKSRKASASTCDRSLRYPVWVYARGCDDGPATIVRYMPHSGRFGVT